MTSVSPELLQTVGEARRRFMELVAEVRPEMHRYCTRMTGSVFDGEDVVQEALARACYALAEMDSPPPLRPWLFRIAHNAAMDFIRSYEHRNVEAVADMERVMDTAGSADAGLETGPDGERVEAALQVFARLPAVQRSALAFKDVLGLSLEEAAAAMETSVGAVKAALGRARASVAAATAAAPDRARGSDVERMRRYADLFNARDWEALRAMFSEETQLHVVSRHQQRGPGASVYFTRYAQSAPEERLHLVVGRVADRPVLAVFRGGAAPGAGDGRPAYFILLDWHGDRIARVRDFRYVPYIAAEADFTF
jgi:RNA polymerase sigma factor (sigma-70 family)